jgi:hypothetical protein
LKNYQNADKKEIGKFQNLSADNKTTLLFIMRFLLLSIIGCFSFLSPIIYAMSSPFDAILLDEIHPTLNIKYAINKIESNYKAVPFSNRIGHLKIEKNVKLLDPDNFEMQYEFTAQDSDVDLKHLEIQLDMNLENQVMMAEGFQCWSTTKEMDRYSKMSAIPGVVAWFTQFNLQG